ncbi:pentapeptide repeat-containing protein [Pseudoxanthomonas sp. UTMC 1351]|uniref:pentapeptide repeat-containing protein n=1 Tax=Pseudoxanthomonas sp. UTMC 1351 TaxID=2695853 RepID=UPI0034CED425
MKKQKLEILNAYGERIFVLHVDDASTGFKGLTLETLFAPCAKLPAMDFSGCKMYKPLLSEADLSFSNFSDADLSGANLQNAVLRHVNFSNAKFTQDAFGNSGSVAGADLTSAILDGAVLDGVEYDNDTIFPEFFDPAAHGMVLKTEES